MTNFNLKNQIVSSLRWNALAKLGGQLISWAITLFVIRLLAPADYGLLAMANVVVGLLSMVAEMGFGATLVQAANLEPRQIRQVWGAALILNAGLCGLMLVAAPGIALFYDEPRLTLVVRVISTQFLINAIGLVPDAMLRRSLEFKRLSILEMATAVLGNVVTLGLAILDQGVWALVLGGVVAGLVRAAALHVARPVRLWPSFGFGHARRLVSFGATLTLSRVLSFVFSQADILIGGKVLGKDALGSYSVAMHLATLPMQRVSSVINEIAFSAFAKIQGDRDAITSNLRLAVRLIALTAFPALWGLALIAPELVRLVMGPRWQDVILPLQIIALTVPIRMIGTLVTTATSSVGRVDVSMMTALVGTVLAIPMFLYAAQYGIVGMSLVWVVLAPAMVAYNLYRALPVLRVSTRRICADLLRPTLTSLAMAAAVIGVRTQLATVGDTLRLVVLVGTGIATYLLATALFNRAAAIEALGVLLPARFRMPTRSV